MPKFTGIDVFLINFTSISDLFSERLINISVIFNNLNKRHHGLNFLGKKNKIK